MRLFWRIACDLWVDFDGLLVFTGVKMHDNRVYSNGPPQFDCAGFGGNFTEFAERFDQRSVVLRKFTSSPQVSL